MSQRPWEVYIVYYEPTMQWWEVTSNKEEADQRAEKLGDGYKVMGGILKAQKRLSYEARRRVAAYDERWAHKPQCLGTTPGHCECANCTMERAKQRNDPNRCFCAGTWHCRWCGHEPCTCDPKRVSDLGRVVE